MTARNAGFSIVEVVIASFVLAIAFVGVLTAMTAMSRTAAMAAAVNQATQDARMYMENLRTNNFSMAPLALGTNTIPNGRYVVSASSATSTVRQITVTQFAVVRGRTTQVDLVTVMVRALRN
jgi:type II secretory pathway pseudopilin PulG